MSWSSSGSAPSRAAAASRPWRPPPSDFASWAAIGLPASATASSSRVEVPVRIRSPSAAAQRSPSIASATGPAPMSAGVPSTASTSSSVSTLRPGTASPSGSASSSRSSTARSSNSRMKSRRAPRSGSAAIAAARSTPVSMSYCSVASAFDMRASSAWLTRFSLRLAPEISSTLASTFSSEPNCCSSGRGGFLADPGDAGDVVGGVAAQPHQVGDQLRRHAVALLDGGGVVDLRLADPFRGAHHPHPLADQLVGVAVAGDDHHLDPLLARLADQRGDHVVGLVALDLDVGVAEGLDQRHQVRPLLAQQVGARFALGLVEVVGDLAARHPRVPGDDDPLRVVLVDDFDQHRGEPVDRVGRPPVAGPDRLRQGEEGPVGERVAVDQEELWGVRGHRRPLYEAEEARGLRARSATTGLGGCGSALRCSGGRR